LDQVTSNEVEPKAAAAQALTAWLARHQREAREADAARLGALLPPGGGK